MEEQQNPDSMPNFESTFTTTNESGNLATDNSENVPNSMENGDSATDAVGNVVTDTEPDQVMDGRPLRSTRELNALYRSFKDSEVLDRMVGTCWTKRGETEDNIDDIVLPEQQQETIEIKSDLEVLKEQLEAIWEQPPMLDWDGFCWKCHKTRYLIPCSRCIRSYHRSCAKSHNIVDDNSTDSWVCPECIGMESVINAAKKGRSANITTEELKKMLHLALQRIEKELTDDFIKFTHIISQLPAKYFPGYFEFSTLKQKIQENKFNTAEEFHKDVRFWCNYITLSAKLTRNKTVANINKQIIYICREEVRDIYACPECYLRCHTTSGNWFVELCSPPHPIIWAKMKGYPYWPGKSMGLGNGTNSNSVDVRFFGKHERTYVDLKDCYLFSKESPSNSMQRPRKDYTDGLKESDIYIQNIIQKYGDFKLASHKKLYEPNNEKEQMAEMIPKLAELSEAQNNADESPKSNIDTDSNSEHCFKRKLPHDNAKPSTSKRIKYTEFPKPFIVKIENEEPHENMDHVQINLEILSTDEPKDTGGDMESNETTMQQHISSSEISPINLPVNFSRSLSGNSLVTSISQSSRNDTTASSMNAIVTTNSPSKSPTSSADSPTSTAVEQSPVHVVSSDQSKVAVDNQLDATIMRAGGSIEPPEQTSQLLSCNASPQENSNQLLNGASTTTNTCNGQQLVDVQVQELLANEFKSNVISQRARKSFPKSGNANASPKKSKQGLNVVPPMRRQSMISTPTNTCNGQQLVDVQVPELLANEFKSNVISQRARKSFPKRGNANASPKKSKQGLNVVPSYCSPTAIDTNLAISSSHVAAKAATSTHISTEMHVSPENSIPAPGAEMPVSFNADRLDATLANFGDNVNVHLSTQTTKCDVASSPMHPSAPSDASSISRTIEEENERAEPSVVSREALDVQFAALNRRIDLMNEKHTQEILKMDEKHEQSLLELRSALDKKQQIAVNLAKRKRWCAYCLKEASFRCCWDTYYCSIRCQSSDWSHHEPQCKQCSPEAATSAITSITTTTVNNVPSTSNNSLQANSNVLPSPMEQSINPPMQTAGTAIPPNPLQLRLAGTTLTMLSRIRFPATAADKPKQGEGNARTL